MLVFAMILIFSVGSYEKGKQDQYIRDKYMIEFYKEAAEKAGQDKGKRK